MKQKNFCQYNNANRGYNNLIGGGLDAALACARPPLILVEGRALWWPSYAENLSSGPSKTQPPRLEWLEKADSWTSALGKIRGVFCFMRRWLLGEAGVKEDLLRLSSWGLNLGLTFSLYLCFHVAIIQSVLPVFVWKAKGQELDKLWI